MTWELNVRFTTDPPAMRAVRRLVASACRDEGASEIEAGLVGMSLGEALSNARLHAYHNGIGPVMVDVEYRQPRMIVSVHDHGSPVLDTTTVPDTLPDQESRDWGLYVIGRVMDEVEIERSPHSDHGTLIRMTKHLSIA
jgi:anti-sigma regulatory factor (Ser/Thr protein kinase)